MADIISSLSTYNRISGDKSPRTAKIDTITIHHAAAVGFTAKQGVDYFYTIGQNPNQEGSANYYIGTDGSIGCSVPENYRAWTSCNPANDNRAVTIEVANSKGEPNWEISDKSMVSLINLVADICKRNGIKKLLWKNDKSLIGKIDQQNMTLHKWFAATGCPGPYLESKMGYIADQVNIQLGMVPAAIKAGDIVKIKSGAKYYGTNNVVPTMITNKEWIVYSVNGDRVVIDKSTDNTMSIMSAFYKSDLILVKSSTSQTIKEPVATTLKIGDKVKLAKNAPVYSTNQKFAFFVYALPLYVRSISKNKIGVSIFKNSGLTGYVDKKYLTKA